MFLGIPTLLVFEYKCYCGLLQYCRINCNICPGIPFIVLMGSVLEVGKLLATVWLHQNWKRAPGAIKYYLTTAVVVLMFINVWVCLVF